MEAGVEEIEPTVQGQLFRMEQIPGHPGQGEGFGREYALGGGIVNSQDGYGLLERALVAIPGSEKHRDQGRRPIVAMNEIHSDPGFPNELHDRPAEERDPLVIVQVRNVGRAKDAFAVEVFGIFDEINGKPAAGRFGIDGGIDSPLAAALLPLGMGDTFKYTGRGEYDLIFDLEKFGGLPHGRLLVRAEHWYGEFGNVSLHTGALTPAVFPALLPPVPDGEGVPYITNFLFTQPLSEKLIVFAGKKDVLGAADQDIFAGGDGTSQFVNQAFIANPAFLLALPYTGFTAGAIMPQSWGAVSAFVYDPKNRTKDFFNLDDLFANGIIVGGQVNLNTNFFCLPGEHHVGGLWKHVDLIDLGFNEPPPGEYPYPQGGLVTKPETYTIFYGFDQYVATYGPPDARGNPEGWGFFGRASIADGATGNPNWAAWHVSAGIGGSSPLCRRRGKGDRFGIGYAYTATSTEFGAIPQGWFAPRDAQVIEAYYRYQLTPAIEVTPDIQWVHGMLGRLTGGDGAIVGGIRLNMKL